MLKIDDLPCLLKYSKLFLVVSTFWNKGKTKAWTKLIAPY